MKTRYPQDKPTPRDQEEIFLKSAGDAYFDRNYSDEVEEKRLAGDRIVSLHDQLHLPAPRKMLEIGCMTGHRCELFRRRFGAQAFGVEPSSKAVQMGRKRYPEVQLEVGVLTALPFAGMTFDCIVLGNFLFWVDRESLFQAANILNSALEDEGIVYFLDFDPIYPQKNAFAHHDGCFTYKMHHYKMLTWHPHYSIIHQTYYHNDEYNFAKSRNDCSQITIIRKDTSQGFADSPAAAPGKQGA